MNIIKHFIHAAALILVTTWGASQASASYDYVISDGGNLIGGFSVSVDGNAESGILVGGMRATAQGPGVPGYADFTTVCLDLSGRIYLGRTYTFNETAFSGQTGLNPSWSNPWSNPADPAAASQAVNNAAFLYASHSNLSAPSDWAALQLAVWKVLYDTDANGNVIWGNTSRFLVSCDPTPGGRAWNEAQDWISELPRDTDFAGYLLRPVDATAQELMLGHVPLVPEPGILALWTALLVLFALRSLHRLRSRGR